MKHDLSETCYGFFSTLANPTRLAILESLREGSRNVTAISEALEQEQSMVSHNLKPLERCGLVFIERRGREKVYSLNRKTVETIFTAVEHHAENFCPAKGRCEHSR